MFEGGGENGNKISGREKAICTLLHRPNSPLAGPLSERTGLPRRHRALDAGLRRLAAQTAHVTSWENVTEKSTDEEG